MTKKAQGRKELLGLAVKTFVDHPYEGLSLQGVADACGVSLWAYRYHFQNVERLFRAVAWHLVGELETRLSCQPAPGARVMDVITAQAVFLAELFEDESYRSLLYFVLRNGRHHPWLERAYEKHVVSKSCTSLETMVLDAGRAHGAPILLGAGAARRLYKRLETELALSALLPSQSGIPIDRAEVIRAAACEAFAATYVFDWIVPTAA